MKLKNNTYYWTGFTPDAKQISGEIQAFSVNLAQVNLQHQGIFILTIRKKKQLMHKIYKKKISVTDISLFYRQLATLISAGVPMVQSCEILFQSQHKEFLKKLILNLKNKLETGQQLSQVLIKYPNYFDSLSCHLIQIAEYSGTLDIMLKRIADHKEKMILLKNKIKQALFYPVIIIIVALIMMLTMLIIVIPRFAELFKNFDRELPWLTLKVIYFSNWFRSHIILIPVVLLLIVVFIYLYHQYFFIKKISDKYLFKIPIIGNLLIKFILLRFTHTLATQVAAGIPIVQSLRMLAGLNQNYIFQATIRKLEQEITAGQHLNKALQNNKFFPALVVQMVKVGEETGSLELMLKKTAEFYESELDYWLGNFSQLLEPLIIIVLGVLIGTLVIAMYLPIFKLGTVL